ncbi:MAG: hypothetical protein ABWZ91_11860 [Nocardioides sp.]
MSEAPQRVTVTVETEVDDDTAARYYKLYHDTFSALQVKAVARQLRHEDEFMEEMHDPRVHKYVAWADGEAIGLSTLTRHLETVPWISPQYFAYHFPEHTARNAVFYLGFTLVVPHRRQSRIFQAMIEKVVELLVSERAICAWDICSHNDMTLSLQDNIERLLYRRADVTVAPIDRQTYYAGTFRGPAAD